jgi:hypothetical protein
MNKQAKESKTQRMKGVVSRAVAVLTPIAKRTPDEWVALIKESWKKSAEGMVETCLRLREARKDIGHGEWEKFANQRLPFSKRTADRLIEIAENGFVTNGTHMSHLPPSWSTVHALIKLPDKVLEKGIKEGVINPGMTLKDVMALKKGRKNGTAFGAPPPAEPETPPEKSDGKSDPKFWHRFEKLIDQVCKEAQERAKESHYTEDKLGDDETSIDAFIERLTALKVNLKTFTRTDPSPTLKVVEGRSGKVKSGTRGRKEK